jgi:uncharacterized phage-associated protein
MERGAYTRVFLLPFVHTCYMPARSSNEDSELYEDDVTVEELRDIMRRPPDAVTGRPASVVDVAEVLLEKLGPLTGLELDALCYLVQGNHLARTGLPAFLEAIEASPSGPVIPRLHEEWKGARRVRSVHGNPQVAEKDDTVHQVIEQVVAYHSRTSGPWLKDLISEQKPWLDARDGHGPRRHSHRIDPIAMREFFRSPLRDDSEFWK